MTELRVDSLRVSVGGTTLVDDVSLRVAAGEIIALIGPNGAGKSMTLRAALGLVAATGEVTVGGKSVSLMSASARARRIAYLPQSVTTAWPARVRDVVALGRFAYGAAPGRLSNTDADVVDQSLDACGLTTFADRAVDTLSGGELARVHCARAFCANTPFLLADEPVAALDPAQAFRVMDLLRDKADDGLGVLVVLHDIALAARYADRLIMMKDGRILADGPVDEVLSEDALADLFGVRATVTGRDVTLHGAI